MFGLAALNEAVAECFDDGFGLGMDLKFFVDIAEMKIDRAGRDRQFSRRYTGGAREFTVEARNLRGIIKENGPPLPRPR